MKKGVSFILFSSHTPCGDASIMEKESNPNEIKCKEADELQPSSINTTQDYDKPEDNCEPPNKIIRTELTDIHRTGAKCVEGGPQVCCSTFVKM